MAEKYPVIEEQLADLCQRIDANDKKIEYINKLALPNDVDRLLVAELVARRLPGFVANGISTASYPALRLPAFHSAYDPYIWPRTPKPWAKLRLISQLVRIGRVVILFRVPLMHNLIGH